MLSLYQRKFCYFINYFRMDRNKIFMMNRKFIFKGTLTLLKLRKY